MECYSLTGSGQGNLEAREARGHSKQSFRAREKREKKRKRKKRKKNLRDPGSPVMEGLTLDHSNTILAKGSNPEIKLTRIEETHILKPVVCIEITL